MKRSKRINHLIRLTCLAGAVFCYSAVGYAAVMSNATLPTGGQLVAGSASGYDTSAGNVMNIEGINNAVIKWDSFDIGSIATVNFSGTEGFNILNYVASGGNMSQIHGTMNAQGGNVYLVNPAGVFIGKSAQIDVGSLYVSNKKLDEDRLNTFDGSNINSMFADEQPQTPAELMSLGHINATGELGVTFDGDRIVLDTEHLTQGIDTPIGDENINIVTGDADNVVLGYVGYDGTKYLESNEEKLFAVQVRGENGKTTSKKIKGYMWVEDVEQLQAISTNLSGNYALRNGIDATNTAETAFTAIGSGDKAFTGKLDGLAGRVDGVDFSIFDLHVGGDTYDDNQGLLAKTENATLKNLIFVSGSTKGNGTNIGTLVGSAVGGVIANVQSSSNVTGGAGSSNVGGIVGSAEGVAMSELLNTGKVEGTQNVGGLVGSMAGGSLTDGRNIGQINGVDGVDNNAAYSHDIGGIAGSINGAALSNVTNDLTVTGGYNVGGIAGSMQASSITDATNTADITATGYTTEEYYYHTANSGEDNYDSKTSTAHKTVRIANVGGIVGSSSEESKITEAFNSGDVKTVTDKQGNYDYYIAGNVGGIVGRAEDTVISSVENKESHVFGAHNVGGIAGYLGGKSSISSATNNGGEIMATGARNEDAFVKELIRGNAAYSSDERVIIGNMGGIVGYMYGDDACITGAGNRGLVHSEEALKADNVPETAKAANVGGIVGKIDRNKTKSVENLSGEDESGKDNLLSAAVSNSYNTGEVYGYTGIGGIAGMMYNGEIVSSYNLGTLRSNYQPTDLNGNQTYAALNMGGIVGDTTENTTAKALLYDVCNKGQIGDSTYTYYGRHVGGVVGRLTGDIEKAYNTGEIFNASTATGGIVGWWYDGDITNVFNTGNVTVVNKSTEDSRVGGIAGSIGSNAVTLENAYNLGTIRSFRYGTSGNNVDTLSGIIGRILVSGEKVTINNVYTVGNIYSGYIDINNTLNHETAGAWQDRECAIVGLLDTATKTSANIKNAFYITPAQVDTKKGKDHYAVDGFVDLSNYDIRLNGANPITYGDRFSESSWETLLENEKGEDTGIWRRYDGTTPILNAFMPSSVDYFGKNSDEWSKKDTNIDNVQYGTAYDPLLTIVEMKPDSTLEIGNWGDTGIKKNESIAVYNGGLSIGGFANATESNYYGSIIYADGALSITSGTTEAIRLGSASQLYGSSITIQNAGDIISYGSITAHGKQQTQDSDATPTTGNISISGANVELIGEVISIAQGETLTVDGIWKSPAQITYTGINQWKKSLESVGKKYAYEVTSIDEEGEGGALANGDISITATATDGEVEALLGNQQTGFISSGGSISFTGSSVYVDSDVSFGNGADTKFTITADEAVLDISNIGKAQADEYSSSVQILHSFLEQGNKLSFAGKTDASVTDAIIAVDMWDDAAGKFDLNQYYNGEVDTFAIALANFGADNSSKIHIWLDSAEQLQGINDYYNENNQSGILIYNFALKNDIDANSLKNFHGIGYGTGKKDSAATDSFNVAFTGALDGRGYSIIGLNASTDTDTDSNFDYVGLFSRIGAEGSVKDLNIVSSNFTGGSVGAVAGRNEGTITNVTTFGNRVTSNGSVLTDVFGTGRHYVGAAGGITGINQGTVENVTASDAVIAGIAGQKPSGEQPDLLNVVDSTAGGIAGVNVGGTIKGSIANTAVVSSEDANSLGGIAGINYGKISSDGKEPSIIDTVESLGVINGIYKAEEKIASTNNVGGIAGVNINGATITNAYNEAHISGANAIGGVVGYVGNTDGSKVTNKIENVVNAGIVIADLDNGETKNTGGLVGSLDQAELSNARNVGTVTGVNNVGGIVGTNGKDSVLKNIVNNGSATIVGETNVGGIAGVNDGNINADPENGSNITNEGTIHGQSYVGGIAGLNNGEISNTISNITLYVKDETEDAQYFGGVAGQNLGTISDATNNGNVFAFGANYVGGIAGVNGNSEGKKGTLTGAHNSNSGTVIGQDQDNMTAAEDQATGGVIGVNYGTITYSDLINEADSIVVGKNNVGGVIGVNYGTVAGERDTGDNYYAYQVYNNGTVVGAEVKEELADGDTDADWTSVTVNYQDPNNTQGIIQKTVYYKASYTSKDIGGLIGVNGVDNNDSSNIKTGSLTAAYNTGNVSGGTNVGGVVGSNSGTVDQVFNAGEIKALAEKGIVGTVAGVNADEGTITNAYDVNSSDSLDGTVGSGQKVVIQDNADGSVIWKTYGNGEKYGTEKLLSVFLTKLTFNKDVNAKDADFVYNAYTQGIVVKAEDNIVKVYKDENVNDESNDLKLLGTITANDAGGAHSLADYLNTLDSSMSNLLTGKALLKDNAGKTNAGSYDDIFASQQINTNGTDSNPNNLGFDITGTVNVQKATISNADLKLSDVYRTYGDINLINSSKYSINFVDGTALNNAMKDELQGLLNGGTITDGALKEDAGEKRTNNVGTYSWTWTAASNDALSANYDLSGMKDLKGNSIVEARALTLNNVIAQIVYGNGNEEVDWTKVVQAMQGGSLDASNGIVYDDEISVDYSKADVSVVEGSTYENNRGNRYTANANENPYKSSLNITGVVLAGNDKGNYKIDGSASGDIKVDKAKLELTINDESIKYGDSAPAYGYTVVQDAVNGDSLEELLSVEYSTDGILNNGHTNNVGSYDINGTAVAVKDSKVDTNYDVKINDGKLTINPAQLTINVKDMETVYGQKFDESKYGYGFGEGAGLVNGDSKDILGSISYANSAAKDGTNGVWTKDAGSYEGAVSIEGLSTLDNYDVTVNAGNAKVNKAELKITLNDVTRVYGNLDKADYGYNVDNLTNGDTEESLKLLLNVLSDGAIAEGTIDSPTKTSDAGSYEWTANVSGAEGLEKNYNVKVTDGKSDVTKAHITITVNDQTMPAGGDQPQYTGNISGITNGDSDTGLFGDYSYGPQDDGVAAEVGKHTIGITIDGQYYDLDSSLNNGTLSENYTYEIKSGTLTVTGPTDPTDPIDPTKPIDPTDPSNPDVWQAEDKYPWYQWDKQRNERERKAEVHFVDGGMTIH